MKLNEYWGILKTTVKKWLGDNTFMIGGSLAFYTLFSLAPVVVIAVSVAGAVFGEQEARQHFGEELGTLAGPQVAAGIEKFGQSAQQSGGSTLATVLSIILLVVGSTTVFVQLQNALNTIWGVQLKPGRPVTTYLRERFWSFAVVVGFGFLLLVSLVISTVLAAVAQFLSPEHLPGGVILWRFVNAVISFGLITLMFAMVYKLLPDAQIEWGDVWVGSAVTALLFTVGKYLIGLYLGQSSWTSVYGAAGSLVVVLMWVYYSSQVFLLGAEFTRVYADHFGKPLRPTRNAELAPKEQCEHEEHRREPQHA